MKETFLAWCVTPVGILVLVLLILNVFTFFAYGWDKWKAKHGSKRRTPEKTLLTLAVIGGSVGAIMGMKTWRHKTLHKQFYIGLPVILALQILIVGGGLIYWNFFR